MKSRVEGDYKITEYPNGAVITERHSKNPPPIERAKPQVTIEHLAEKVEELIAKIDAMVKK